MYRSRFVLLTQVGWPWPAHKAFHRRSSGVISAARSWRSPWIARRFVWVRNSFLDKAYSSRNTLEFLSISRPLRQASIALTDSPLKRKARARRRWPFKKSGRNFVHSSASNRAFSKLPSSKKQRARFE